MSARRRRLAVTGLAVLAPVLVWLVADPVLGHRLRIIADEQPLDIGAVPVVLVALLAALAGWGLLAALERFWVRRARAVWTGVAVAVLAISFLPLTGDGMDGATRAALALIHLAVAAVLIPGLRRKDAAAATPQASDGGSPARQSRGQG
ncbi:DUF6069 family protein [Streptomyces odonnellii]|uniref:DUF6069 family protein n=1 Tax=Streptomyces odonnellii TaxID=1417980 RepID=UPI000625E391|nr:DUF6069 family protein [Streptomyces odonnellii]